MVSRKCRGRLGIEEGDMDFPDTKEIQRKSVPPLTIPHPFSLILSAVTYGARTERRSAGSVFM